MVTVLMPVYNGEKYLREAIESVLNQSFKDFEFLIINDGSTDRSSEIVNSYNDPRINFIDNKNNSKLIATLNQGLKLARGKYIVRMDCDDVCYPERLSEQVQFMEANPDVGISGTWYVRSDNSKVVQKPLSHDEIKVNLLRGASILHPTAIFRKEFFDRFNLVFDPEFIHAEDYELWVKGARLFRLGNLPKVLLKYRKHPKQVSQHFAKEQKETTLKIMASQLHELGIIPNEELLTLHYELFTKSKLDHLQVLKLQSHVGLLLAQNEKKQIYDQEVLKKFLYLCRDFLWDRFNEYNLKTLSLFHKSRLNQSTNFSFILYLKIIKRVVVHKLQF